MPEETRLREGGSGPRQVDLAEVRGKVDFGIVAIREDEFRALLHYFPVESRAKGTALVQLLETSPARGAILLYCNAPLR